MRAAAILLVLSLRAFAQSACGPADVQFKLTTDNSQHPLPAPEPGKARVFVINRTTDARIAVDGQWVGAGASGSYFSFSLNPGLHHLCAAFSNWLDREVAAHSLDAKAGETYYFAARIPHLGDPELVPLDPDEAALLLAQSKFSTARQR